MNAAMVVENSFWLWFEHSSFVAQCCFTGCSFRTPPSLQRLHFLLQWLLAGLLAGLQHLPLGLTWALRRWRRSAPGGGGAGGAGRRASELL